MPQYQKELTEITYDSAGIKVTPWRKIDAHKLAISVHWHDRLEILIIQSGTLLLNVGDRIIPIHSGQVGIINPRQPHGGFAADEPVSMQALMFDISYLFNGTPVSRSLLSSLYSGATYFENFCDDPQVISLINRIAADYPTDDPCDALCKQSDLYTLIGILCRSHAHQSRSKTICDDRFQDVLDYVNAYYTEDLRCAQLCSKYGYDESYFCRRFKAVTGLPLTRYIRILRLEQALSMLQDSSKTIREVAITCGFTDASYFTRCFRDHFGSSPTEYLDQQNT